MCLYIDSYTNAISDTTDDFKSYINSFSVVLRHSCLSVNDYGKCMGNLLAVRNTKIGIFLIAIIRLMS